MIAWTQLDNHEYIYYGRLQGPYAGESRRGNLRGVMRPLWGFWWGGGFLDGIWEGGRAVGKEVFPIGSAKPPKDIFQTRKLVLLGQDSFH